MSDAREAWLRTVYVVAAVVTVLALLGSGLARVGLPGPWNRLPWMAAPYYTPDPAPARAVYKGTVSWVADGDTFTMATIGGPVTVRLLGIDAPEVAHGASPAGCGGEAAAAALRAMLPAGTAVTAVTDPASDARDAYGRVLAYASTATVPDAGLAMVAGGWASAWVPAGEPRNSRWPLYDAAKREASASRAGAWANCPVVGRS